MNVYDFDGTIYDGESVFDFYLFTVKRQPKLLKYLYVVMKTLIRYKLCKVSESELLYLAKKYAGQYLQELHNPEQTVCDFWDKYQKKIKPFYSLIQKEDDIVISASVELLLKEILNRIGVKQYICTVLDVENGEITEFCYRKTKVSLFQSKYPNTVIENFYTDSENDRAMIKIAKKSFLVKGNSVKQIKQMEE